MSKNDTMKEFIETFLETLSQDIDSPLKSLLDELKKQTKETDEPEEKEEDNEDKGILVASFYKHKTGVGIELPTNDYDVLPNVLFTLLTAVNENYNPIVLKSVLSKFEESIKTRTDTDSLN